jgi:hypothetical protein
VVLGAVDDAHRAGDGGHLSVTGGSARPLGAIVQSPDATHAIEDVAAVRIRWYRSRWS